MHLNAHLHEQSVIGKKDSDSDNIITCHKTLGDATTNKPVSMCCHNAQGAKVSAATVIIAGISLQKTLPMQMSLNLHSTQSGRLPALP